MPASLEDEIVRKRAFWDFASQRRCLWPGLPDSMDLVGLERWSEITGLGDVQDPGRFIFSAQPGDSSGSWLENVPTIPSWLVNGIAGAGDKFTSIPFTNFSVTVWARRVIPGGDTTDTNTRSYRVGGWIGTGYQAVLASAPLAADIAEVQAGKLFGTRFGGNQPLLNSNDTLRIGWSYIWMELH